MSTIPSTTGDAPPVHCLTTIEAAEGQGVDPLTGLAADEVERRRLVHGPNALEEAHRRPSWLRFLDQFRTMISAVLAGAAVLSAAVGDWKDPIVISAVLLLNAVLGWAQESRAENALAALDKMMARSARVRRDGRNMEVPSADLVPGDVVLLEAGDRVPADGRLLVAASLALDESSLTGESEPVDKHTDPEPSPTAPVADRRNCGYMNTTVVRGRAELLVTETGMGTEIGRVAGMLASSKPPQTPLQRQLDVLGRWLAALALVAGVVVLALRLLQGDTLSEALLASVALAVAAIPEGLPAVVTVTLAVGVSRMAAQRAIVKRLPSVETLGATTVICSDKTGTLTMNQMTARRVTTAHTTWSASSEGFARAGELVADGADAHDPPTDLLRAGVLANDATVHDGTLVGDPTEGALVVLAAAGGLDAEAERREHPRIAEVPFDSATKLMATLHRHDGGTLVCTKGAPEVLLDRCGSWRDGSELRPMGSEDLQLWTERNLELSSAGLRTLAVASRIVADADPATVEPAELLDDLVLEGLVGIVDPARSEARDAIETCHTAGIDVKMITGDNPATATAIAAELGIEGEVVTGAELDDLDDEELRRRIGGIGVCARVAPAHKVRVVEALQAGGEVVAMTGDGVNDAPALRTAEIGVAMGVTGTEVTREAGDMILTDDNFATIVGAVERGRAIYDNIVKFVRFQVTTNLAAIGTILGASVAGLPLPLSAIQLLWVNIIADGPPAMSLGLDSPEPGVMRRPPRSPGSPILSARRLGVMVWSALVMSAGTLALFVLSRDAYDDEVAATMAFTAFVLFQMVNVFNVRREHDSVFSRYTFTNWRVWAAVATVVALQVLATRWGPAQSVFDTATLGLTQWAICAATALAVLVAEEARLLVVSVLRRRREP